jgi:hypothetical protein
MMLDLMWTVGFLLAGVLVIARQTYVECTRYDIEDDDFGSYASRAIAGICCVIMSVAAGWDLTAHPLFAWFSHVLPDPAAAVHTLTAASLTGAVLAAYVLAVPLITASTVSIFFGRREHKGVETPATTASVTYLSDVRK